MPTVAEYLARELKRIGVTTVFGLPGGENVELLEAIRKQDIDFILVKNESSACFMASTQAQLTGTLGVALTTLGPGATNAVVGLAHAYLDRAPILLLTAQTDPHLIGTHTHQVIDLQAIFSPITKYTDELSSDLASSQIYHALTSAVTGRPGPVHLGLNNRIAMQTISTTIHKKDVDDVPAINQTNTLTAIQSILTDKQKPVIVAGLGLNSTGYLADIHTLAELLNAPVIDTPKSKGVLPARHPLFAGTIGLTRSDPVYEILDDADCILAIGFDVVELVKPWNQEQQLIWIAEWENQDPRIAADHEYVGDIGSLLKALQSMLDYTPNSEWGVSRLALFRQIQQTAEQPIPADGRMLPQDVLKALRDNTHDDIIVSTDVGSHKIFTALNWQTQTPNTYFVSNGLSAMGFGLTSAIAATYTTNKSSICVTGDAGMAMVIGELGLIKDMMLPVIIVVMNDEALDLIRSAQKRRHRPTFGTEFSNPHYEHIAQAYDLPFRRVNKTSDCANAIIEALHSNKPMLIEAMIDPVGYPTTVQE